MLLLTKLTLYWLNLTWNISTLNKRTALAGCVKNWANSVDHSEGNGTSQNTTASNCSTHGMSHTPSSTTSSLTTKATSISSAAPPVYNKTPTPVLSGLPDDDQDEELPVWSTRKHRTMSDNEFIMPISEAVKTGLKCKHADYANAEYIISSEVDEVDNNGYNNTGSLQQTKKIPCCVTAMIKIIIDKPAKKLWTSPSNTMAKQSTELAIAGTTSQTLSAATNSAGTGGGCFHYMNRHLPPALQQDRKWFKQILPTLLR
ncbi:hypothetical protein J3A83DRAFT_4184736 [Scleroderma citrinum]